LKKAAETMKSQEGMDFIGHVRTRTSRALLPKQKNHTCGAKCRDGHACRNTRIYPNGRCKNHGGLSTGPRSAEGKAKVAENLRR